MRILVGTSGYSYKEWKGSFYPEDLPESGMLRFYGGRFRTVEINNTFYRMPAKPTLERWSQEVPPDFTFVLKAPQRITHQKRLTNVSEEVAYFFETASIMGGKQGPVLFQLPPYFHKDLPRLEAFLALLPEAARPAFEFRHESWQDEDVWRALRSFGAALCLADTDDTREEEARLVATAGWGYLRLRRAEYGDADLIAWAERIRSQPWEEAYVFFKHEDEGRGPQFAERFVSLLGA